MQGHSNIAIITDERRILMMEMAFNKNANFSFHSAYLSVSDSQYTLKTVTREIVDAIHKRTTVLTSVIYTVTIVYRVNKN